MSQGDGEPSTGAGRREEAMFRHRFLPAASPHPRDGVKVELPMEERP